MVRITSADERDMSASYNAGANSYMVKPVNVKRLLQAIKRFTVDWFGTVMVPQGD
jgi:response regulator of citrate/malate metabolism